MFSANNLIFPKPAFKSGSCIADQSLAVSSVAVTPTGYTAATTGSNPVQFVAFDVQGANVYCRWDGVAPTSSTGHLLYAGYGYTWPVSQYDTAQFIRSASTDAVIWASAMSS